MNAVEKRILTSDQWIDESKIYFFGRRAIIHSHVICLKFSFVILLSILMNKHLSIQKKLNSSNLP